MLLAQGKVQVDSVRPLYVPAGDHQVVYYPFHMNTQVQRERGLNLGNH